MGKLSLYFIKSHILRILNIYRYQWVYGCVASKEVQERSEERKVPVLHNHVPGIIIEYC